MVKKTLFSRTEENLRSVINDDLSVLFARTNYFFKSFSIEEARHCPRILKESAASDNLSKLFSLQKYITARLKPKLL